MRLLRDPRAGPPVELQGVGEHLQLTTGVRVGPSRDLGSGHVAEIDGTAGFVGGLAERHVPIGPFTKKFARVLAQQLVNSVRC
jgi:hypothetical protein